MEFAEQLRQFAQRIETIQDSIQTEEATKTAIIMPFFAMLGYDVFNPQEFAPEFTADVGIKRGEKVDYAILQDGDPVIIIEAKSIKTNLKEHGSQLFRYFATTSAKFAILTNGVRYRFYTDLENQNKMDAVPFLDFDILHMRDKQIEELSKFKKETFDVARISDSASTLKCQATFKAMLAEQFQEPSDDLLKLFLRDSYKGTKTQSVLERFRPVLKTAMQEFINETMNDKIKNALFDQPASPAPQDSEDTECDVPAVLEPTEAEMDAYYRLKNLFNGYVNLEDITYKKTESYLAVLYQGNARKWICRLIISSNQIIVIVPDKDKKDIRCSISNLYELGNYSKYMLSVIARYAELLKPIVPEHPNVYQVYLKRRFPKRRKR